MLDDEVGAGVCAEGLIALDWLWVCEIWLLFRRQWYTWGCEMIALMLLECCCMKCGV